MATVPNGISGMNSTEFSMQAIFYGSRVSVSVSVSVNVSNVSVSIFIRIKSRLHKSMKTCLYKTFYIPGKGKVLAN